MPIENITPWLLLAACIAAGLSGLLVHANKPHDIECRSPQGANATWTHQAIACALYSLSGVMLVAAVFSWLHWNAADIPFALPKHFDVGGAIALAIIASAIAGAQGKKRRARKSDEHR